VRHAGKAPPLRKTSVSRLTEGRDFGEDRDANLRSFPGLVPDVAARPSGGLFHVWARLSETQPTARRQPRIRLRTAASGQASHA
jgi:hypothetical protein